MKKYLFLVALCLSPLVHSNTVFDRLRQLHDNVHVNIYQAQQDFDAPQPAPEVPYIAGLLGNPTSFINGTPDACSIYGTLYDRFAAGGDRKAIAGIDQAKADAFDAIQFDFARYDGYQNSGHSVLGVAAQEIADPVSRSPSSLSSSTLSSASLKSGADSSAGGGRDTSGMLGQIRAQPKLKKVESSSQKTSGGGGMGGLLGQIQARAKLKKVESSSQKTSGGGGMGGLLGQIQAGTKLNKVESSQKAQLGGVRGVLNQELRAGAQLRKPITSPSASSEITLSDVQAVINDEGRSPLLEELLLRLERTEMQNTSYQAYRFDKLKKWFKNRNKESVAQPLIAALNAIPSSVEGVEQQLADAISTLLPNKKRILEGKKSNLETEKDKLSGSPKRLAEEDIKKTQSEIVLIETDKKLLEELQGILRGADSDPLRLQKLKEFLVTLGAGGQFNSLLEQLRSQLVPLPNAKIPQGSSGGATASSLLLAHSDGASADKSPEISAQRKVVDAIQEQIDRVFGEEESEKRLCIELAEQAKILALLGDLGAVRMIGDIDDNHLEKSDKDEILQQIVTQLEASSSLTQGQETVLLNLQGKFRARNLMAGGGSRVPLAQQQKVAAGGGGKSPVVQQQVVVSPQPVVQTNPTISTPLASHTPAPRLNIVQTGTASSNALAQSIIQRTQAAGGGGRSPVVQQQPVGVVGVVANDFIEADLIIAANSATPQDSVADYLNKLIISTANGEQDRREYLVQLRSNLNVAVAGFLAQKDKSFTVQAAKRGPARRAIAAILETIKTEIGE